MLARLSTRCMLALLQIVMVFTLLFNTPLVSVHAGEQDESKTDVVTVILQREYLDGDISEETLIKQNTSLKKEYDFYLNKGWELVSMQPGEIIFKKEVRDLSPLIKMNGYFGIGSSDTMANFKGKEEKRHIIQSFFQIVLEKMETHLHEEIHRTIPICENSDINLSSRETYLRK